MTWLEILEQTCSGRPEEVEQAVDTYLGMCERGEEEFLSESAIPFLAHIREKHDRLWLSRIVPLVEFWRKEDRARLDKLLDEHRSAPQCAEGAGATLADILDPQLTPDAIADLLRRKDPPAHEWTTDAVAERLLAFAEPGRLAYRTVLNEFFHKSKYSPETRQQIKLMVGQQGMRRNGTIATRSRSLADYRKYPPDPKTYQDPRVMAVTGVTVLAGRPKMGKSYLALNLGLAVASSGKFLSDFEISQSGAVLYLALEDDESRMWSRIQSLLGGDEEPANFFLDFSAPTMTDGQLVEEIEQWMARDDVEKPKLVVIDVFRVVQSARGKQDLYESEYADMIQLNRLAKAHDLHVIIVTHLNKAYSTVEDYADAIMSSTAISGGASGIWILANRGEEGIDADLYISGKDLPKWTCGLKRIDLDGHIDWRVLGDTSILIKGRIQVDILRSLFTWEGQRPTATELKDSIDTRTNKANFFRTLRLLREKNLIGKEKNRYTLTTEGAAAAQMIVYANLDETDFNIVPLDTMDTKERDDNYDTNDTNDTNDYQMGEEEENQRDRDDTWEDEVDFDF